MKDAVDRCVAQVRDTDPARYLSAMTARASGTGDLCVLYAFNLTLAHATWVSAEPTICMMRLQFWDDWIGRIGGTAQVDTGHDLAAPLADLIARRDLPVAQLKALISAWRSTVEMPVPDTHGALHRVLRGTGGTLMALGARALGGACDPIAEDLGEAAAAARYLEAVPDLLERGQQPLPEVRIARSNDGIDGAACARIHTLAEHGLSKLRTVDAQRRSVPPEARPAFRAAWRTEQVLTRALALQEGASPEDLRTEITGKDKRRLLLRTLTGRF